MDNETAEVMRSGFAQVVGAITLTNTKLDETNPRLDATGKRVDETNQRLDAAGKRVDETSRSVDLALERINLAFERIDRAFERVDTTVNAFRQEMRQKLEGIGIYLRSIDGNVESHGERIFKLEKRMDRIEKKRDN